MQFFTIGVFHSTEKEFFDKLTKNRIDTFCDIRQRRGVRGAKYSFVNCNRLQEKLKELGIQYAYIEGLTPTQEVREIQKQKDQERHELISERQTLDKTFTKEYKIRILDRFDFKEFLKTLEHQKSKRIVLFCVEENANACHRSLVAERLKNEYQYDVKNL